MNLRLVHPKSPDQPKPPRRARTAEPLLSPEEARRFRRAIWNLHDQKFRTWRALAAAMGCPTPVSVEHMARGYNGISGDMIVRAMRASGLSLEDLIGPAASVEVCGACGARRRRVA